LDRDNRILGLAGLAVKAGKAACGEFAAEKLIRSGMAKIVLVASDASDNTKKKFTDKCTYYKVPIYICSTKEKLGHATGREERSSIALSDAGFSNAIEKLMKQSGGNDIESQ